MGTPEFAVPTLTALMSAGHRIAAVYTKPPNTGMRRGRTSVPTPVHAYADTVGLDVRTPTSFRDADTILEFLDLGVDVCVVAAYGMILPEVVIDAPPKGCINVHGSILPRWRGAAPVQRAIMSGDDDVGISIMRMEKGLDTGPVYGRRAIPVDGRSCGNLMDDLAQLGATMMTDVLADLDAHHPEPQASAGASYARMLTKTDCRINFGMPAAVIERMVRAMDPCPGAWTSIDGRRLKIYRARVGKGDARPCGMIIDRSMTISCGDGLTITPTEMQWAGRGRILNTAGSRIEERMVGRFVDDVAEFG